MLKRRFLIVVILAVVAATIVVVRAPREVVVDGLLQKSVDKTDKTTGHGMSTPVAYPIFTKEGK